MQAAGLKDLQSGMGSMQTNEMSGRALESPSSDKLPVMDEGADLLDIVGAAQSNTK